LGFAVAELPPSAPVLVNHTAMRVVYLRRGPVVPTMTGGVQQVQYLVPAAAGTMPGQAESIPVIIIPASGRTAVAAEGTAPAFPRSAPGPGRRSYVDLTAAPCFAHSADYKWIVGQVEYSSTAKEWRLRYTSVEEVDRFGGRVILIENQHVNYMRDGMYV